ncbi:MAG: ABC transporter ATP-binding protein [Deltaproteobacteria bacterium]|nr:ABC transporter ATP-binding protein [Deltaproteobacteria bacterium]
MSSSSQSIKNLIGGAWDSTRSQRPRLFAFIALFVIAYTLDLLVPWAIGYTLGVFVKEGFSDAAFANACWGLAAYVGLRLLYNICHHLGRFLQLSVSFEGRMETLENVFATLLRFPLSWHVNHHSGENLSRLHRSAGAIDTTIGTYIWQIIEGLVKVIFASIAIFALDFWVAVNVVVMGFLTIIFMVMFNRRLVQSIRANNAFLDRVNRICVDYLYNIITVKSLNLEENSISYLKAERDAGRKLNKRITGFSELKWGSVGIGYTLVIGSSLFIYFSHHSALADPFDVAQVYVLLNYLDRIFQAIGSFTAYYSGMLESSTAYEDATSILGDRKALPAPSRSGRLADNWKSLQIKDLSFNYSRKGNEGIEAFQLAIPHGAKIALVGPSGGGKSTLLKIMGGLLIPERCDIIVDGKEKLSLDELSSQVLIVPQEPEIFSETARYNLTMGETFSPQEMSFFVSLCKIEDVLAKLPQGWDSYLAESGMNLSVGEKQRVALARGLLRAKNRSLILLDEPTSSLDPMTEKQIFYALLHHFTDRTIITACHRLALVPLFDTIVFIRRGKVEEVGSFAQLLEKKGLFYAAWKDYEEKVFSGAEA